MSEKLVFGCVETIDNPNDYRAFIKANCLDESVTEIAGVPRHARFESLSSDDIARLNEWFQENGRLINLRLSTVEMCLAVLGATLVDPAKSVWNLSVGKGKETQYYDCEANRHNRLVKTGNLGNLSKEGLMHDIANGYWGYGPTGHIDAWGWVLNLQHRDISMIEALLETGGDCPPIDIFVMVNMPPQLAATIDRGASKTAADQEFIDQEQFSFDFVSSIITDETGEDYTPDNFGRFRNELAKSLVTVRNNVWSRLRGTGYHPSKAAQPSARQALALQSCFPAIEGGDELQRLVVRCSIAAITESGSKAIWSKHITPPMLATALVLASNAEQDDSWQTDNPIDIDDSIVDTVLQAMSVVSDGGDDVVSRYLREIAKIKKQPKKPSGMDRWIFWGLVGVIQDLLLDEPVEPEYDDDGKIVERKYFPSVTATMVKQLREKKLSYPLFGGYDCGPISKDDE